MIYVLKEERITPACAGNTVEYVVEHPGDKDHPRLRGEYADALKWISST